MEFARIELRNRSFQEVHFVKNEGLLMRKKKRIDAQWMKRSVDNVFVNVDEKSLKWLGTIELNEIRGVQALNLIEKLADLLRRKVFQEICMLVLGNLAANDDVACEEMTRSGVLFLGLDLITGSDHAVIENAIWCVGNISIGSIEAKQICLHHGAVNSILEFLQSDYEKSDKVISHSLWCIWCIIYNVNIPTQTFDSLLDVLTILVEYPNFQKNSLKLLHALSSQNPFGLNIIIPVLCQQEYLKPKQQLLCVAVLKNLLPSISPNIDIAQFMWKMIGNSWNVSAAVYDFLSLLLENENFQINWELLCKAIEDLNSAYLGLAKAAARLLEKIGNIGQATLFDAFNEQGLEGVQKALRNNDADFIHSLVVLSKILLKSGFAERFIQTGCVDALSSAYFRCKNETSDLITLIFEEFFEKA